VNTPEQVYQIALTALKGFGPIKTRQLLTKIHHLEDLFELPIPELEKITGIPQKTLYAMDRKEALLYGKKCYAYNSRKGIQTHFIIDKTYPRRLRECADAPLVLFSKGNCDFNYDRVIAVVGTRNATTYGRQICEELIQGIADKNILVISGMAYGIDICIHLLCLKYNVPTIGVLGHGLDRLYPSTHKTTAQRMFENGGLLTEFIPGTNPDRENFPMRNRIVAGMSDATIVVESKISGGSLITAELANEYNRDVFAYPGNVGQQFSEGCNNLILKQKAHLLLGSSHFLEWMQWKDEEKKSTIQRQLFIDLTEDEQKIIDLLNQKNEHIDVLASTLEQPVSKINVLLFQMEMKGLVQSIPGNRFQRV
jgi:DNA processing protein